MKVKNYALVTAGYWAFTLTDGALRMLVLLHFHELGYSPVSIAFLFLAYEFMGIVTNLLGGWVGSRKGLNRTLVAGLGLQIVALVALTLQRSGWREWVSVAFVMSAQALSGVAKDLTKMRSKSAVKAVAGEGDGALFRLVAILTGSKNALKGVGFFLGAALLSGLGYDASLWSMAAMLAVTVVALLTLLDEDIGRSKKKAPLRSVLSKSVAVNRLSAALFFLFGSRDIWFVVALPVFLDEKLGWSFQGIGGFLAAWVIGYGIVQSFAPRLLRRRGATVLDEIHAARRWAFVLAAISVLIAVDVAFDVATTIGIVGGLVLFGIVFALNSSLHSFLILVYSDDDTVALDVGFYYSANAAGRLVGTLLSGVLYLWGGLAAALWASAAFVVVTWLLSLRLPPVPTSAQPSTPLGKLSGDFVTTTGQQSSGDLGRRLMAEGLGTALLIIAVVGSGIMATKLSTDVGLQLLENAAATAAALIGLILIFGAVSGAHFNPAVTLVDRLFGSISTRDAGLYVVVQTVGGCAGTVIANVMFARPTFEWSTRTRSSGALWLSEVVATLGLLLVIHGCIRTGRAAAVPFAVGLWIGGAYWFTSSTSFANPAVTIARMLSNSFAGIKPSSAPMFVLMQVVGACLAYGLIRYLYPQRPSAAE